MGSTVDLDPILEVARAAGLRVIEDTAQAHGAFHRGRRVGTLGDIGCFSFYPTKNLGGWGDGGADRDRRRRPRRSRAPAPLARRAPALPPPDRGHDRAPRRAPGGDPAREAAPARRLERRPPTAGRRPARRASPARPSSCPRPPSRAPTTSTTCSSCARTAATRCGSTSRSTTSSTAVHYPFPIHRTGAYADLGLGPGSLPVAERLSEQICTLPLFPTMSDDEMAHVVAAVASFECLAAPEQSARPESRGPRRGPRLSCSSASPRYAQAPLRAAPRPRNRSRADARRAAASTTPLAAGRAPARRRDGPLSCERSADCAQAPARAASRRRAPCATAVPRRLRGAAPRERCRPRAAARRDRHAPAAWRRDSPPADASPTRWARRPSVGDGAPAVAPSARLARLARRSALELRASVRRRATSAGRG